jgi:hypothetical protein
LKIDFEGGFDAGVSSRFIACASLFEENTMSGKHTALWDRGYKGCKRPKSPPFGGNKQTGLGAIPAFDSGP